jgi:hypothetical protein
MSNCELPNLSPTGIEWLRSDSRSVAIPKATLVLELWKGEPPDDTYGGKAILDADGEPAFAEVLILRSFQGAGWNGVWVDTYRRSYRRSPNDIVPTLPRRAEEALQAIRAVAAPEARCWDVFCWRGSSFKFAEAKRRGRDRLRKSQILWCQAAIQAGFSSQDFLVVEWTVSAP